MVKGAKRFHLATMSVVKVLLLWFLLHQLTLHFSVLEAICSVSGGDDLTSLMALLQKMWRHRVYEEK
jgi:hypothetical protein